MLKKIPMKNLSDLIKYRGLSWAYEAAEEGEIKKNWHMLEKVNKTKTAKVKRIIFAEYF